jgi:hypothetical protein
MLHLLFQCVEKTRLTTLDNQKKLNLFSALNIKQLQVNRRFQKIQQK